MTDSKTLSLELLLLNDLLHMRAIDDNLYAMAVQKIQISCRNVESGNQATA